MDIEQQSIDAQITRAVEDFNTNQLCARLLWRMAKEYPEIFLRNALEQLNTVKPLPVHYYLMTLVLKHEEVFQLLTDPGLGSPAEAATRFERLLKIDPSLDVRLAHKLPDRRASNLAEALDSSHSTRAIDILDRTCPGRRLLPVIGHLVNSADKRIAAKAALFVGRRTQDLNWTQNQLGQADQRARANAVEALWGQDSPEAIDIMKSCTQDANNRVRGNSLVALYMAGDKEIEQEVFNISNASRPDIRSTAAWVLGRMTSKEALDRLTQMVKDENQMVRSTALRTLLAIRRNGAKRSPEEKPVAQPATGQSPF